MTISGLWNWSRSIPLLAHGLMRTNARKPDRAVWVIITWRTKVRFVYAQRKELEWANAEMSAFSKYTTAECVEWVQLAKLLVARSLSYHCLCCLQFTDGKCWMLSYKIGHYSSGLELMIFSRVIMLILLLFSHFLLLFCLWIFLVQKFLISVITRRLLGTFMGFSGTTVPGGLWCSKKLQIEVT